MRHGSRLGLCNVTHVRMPSRRSRALPSGPPWCRRCEGACIFATHKMQQSLRDERPLPMSTATSREVRVSSVPSIDWSTAARLELSVFLQRLEPRLKPNLRDQRGNHCTSDHCGQKNGVLLLVDDVVSQSK